MNGVFASCEQKDEDLDLWPGFGLFSLLLSQSHLHNLHLDHCLETHQNSHLPMSYQNLQIQKYVFD